MKIKFRDIKLSKDNKDRLEVINRIIEEYQEDGYTLTLRQLYYQLVSRDIIPNEQKEYAKLSKLLKEGRMAGVVDWEAIEDRVRNLSKPSNWDSPKSILEVAHSQYRKDRLKDQYVHIEVWVEKDALSSVVERATDPYGIGVMVNRGYSSVSAMFEAYERFSERIKEGKSIYILYIGDHDPSGVDMIRDVQERIGEMLKSQDLFKWYKDCPAFFKGRIPLEEVAKDFVYFIENKFFVLPIALTDEQIETYDPPPNPTKLQDPRAAEYMERYGETCWEVDALPPQVLNELITSEIKALIDEEKYQDILQKEEEEKEKLESFISEF